jgi:hypothetical protein
LDDALQAVIFGAGHNLRTILARLRALYCLLIEVLAIRHSEVHLYGRGEAELTNAQCRSISLSTCIRC